MGKIFLVRAVVLIQNSLRVVGTTNNRHSDSQSFPGFVKFCGPCTLVYFVHQVYVKIVHLRVSENERSFIDVESCKFHALDMFYEDCYRDFRGQRVNWFEALPLDTVLVSLPSVADFNWIRMD